MKAKVRKILFESIERGVINGYHRAHKHTNDPSESAITENIMREISYEIDDNFCFDTELE
jgi:hypothetical protein